MSARWIGSETSGRAASSSIRARSTRPASQAFSAAAVSRRARCSSSAVSAAARSKASEAAAKPLRRRARSAACLELLTDGRVGLDARRGAVPGAAIGIGLAVEHARERAVDGLPPGERRRLVDGGADKRVAKLEPRSAHVHQPCLFGLVERLGPGSELRRGAQHGRELAAVVGAGDEQERLRLLREPIHARKECVLDAGADRYRSKHRLGARELRLAQGGGELEQGERVARPSRRRAGRGAPARDRRLPSGRSTSQPPPGRARPAAAPGARAPRSAERRPRERAKSMAMPSASSRLATKTSASADASSSHCASSTRHRSG